MVSLPPWAEIRNHTIAEELDEGEIPAIAYCRIRKIQQFARSPSMQAVKAEVVPSNTISKACLPPRPDSDEQWECIIQAQAIDSFHPVGTCKMGSKYDRTSVVDPELRVKGIKGLRVADASIMPEVTSGNTTGPSIIIREKAADMIMKDYMSKHH